MRSINDIVTDYSSSKPLAISELDCEENAEKIQRVQMYRQLLISEKGGETEWLKSVHIPTLLVYACKYVEKYGKPYSIVKDGMPEPDLLAEARFEQILATNDETRVILVPRYLNNSIINNIDMEKGLPFLMNFPLKGCYVDVNGYAGIDGFYMAKDKICAREGDIHNMNLLCLSVKGNRVNYKTRGFSLDCKPGGCRKCKKCTDDFSGISGTCVRILIYLHEVIERVCKEKKESKELFVVSSHIFDSWMDYFPIMWAF